MRAILIIFILLCGDVALAAEEEHYLTYVPQGLPAKRENPGQLMTSISLQSCVQYYKIGRFTLYMFEDESLRKEKRLGKQALDADDIKWITSAENRKVACMRLLERNNVLSLRDRILRWWNGE